MTYEAALQQLAAHNAKCGTRKDRMWLDGTRWLRKRVVEGVCVVAEVGLYRWTGDPVMTLWPDRTVLCANGWGRSSGSGWGHSPPVVRLINDYGPSSSRHWVCPYRGTWLVGGYPWERAWPEDVTLTVWLDGRVDGLVERTQTQIDSEVRRAWYVRASQRPGFHQLRYWRVQARLHKPGRLTVQKVLQEPNATVRVCKMYAYGVDRFALEAGTPLDAHGEYALLAIGKQPKRWRPETASDETMKVLKMVCPSTGVAYLATLPPTVQTVAQGLDWYFQVEDYLGRIESES